MLGIGLHSYGFMDAAFYWLIAFVSSQVLLIAITLSSLRAPTPASGRTWPLIAARPEMAPRPIVSTAVDGTTGRTRSCHDGATCSTAQARGEHTHLCRLPA